MDLNGKSKWRQRTPLILGISIIVLVITILTFDTLEDVLVEGNPFSGTILGSLLNALATLTINVTSTVEVWGYLGIFVLMVLESSSLPVPSEIVLPFAGYLVSQGVLDFWLVVTISTIAGLAGSLIDYYIGLKGMDALLKNNKIRRMLFSQGRITMTEKLFVKYDAPAVFLSRLIPGFRTLISFPAGAVKMSLAKFTTYTFIGCLIWNAVLTYVGVYVGANWRAVAGFTHYIIIIAAATLLIVVGIFLITRRRHKKTILNQRNNTPKVA